MTQSVPVRFYCRVMQLTNYSPPITGDRRHPRWLEQRAKRISYLRVVPLGRAPRVRSPSPSPIFISNPLWNRRLVCFASAEPPDR